MFTLAHQSGSPATAEEEAYRHLRGALRLGRYRAGDRLVADEIASQIGVSRMPVREALRRLSAEGLVILRPNRGCIVAGLTLAELYEVFEIRSVLEGLAVRLAMPRMDEETIEELSQILGRMERAAAGGGSDWVLKHQEFHARLCERSERPKLVSQIAALHTVIEPYMRIWFDLAHKPVSARDEHLRVIDALRTGDPDLAEAVMREHVLGTAPMLAEYASPARLK